MYKTNDICFAVGPHTEIGMSFLQIYGFDIAIDIEHGIHEKCSKSLPYELKRRNLSAQKLRMVNGPDLTELQHSSTRTSVGYGMHMLMENIFIVEKIRGRGTLSKSHLNCAKIVGSC